MSPVGTPVVVYGLTGTLTEIAAIADHPLVAVLVLSLALIYTLFVGVAVFTALRSDDPCRRETAVEVLKVLTGFKVSSPGRESAAKVDKPKEVGGP